MTATLRFHGHNSDMAKHKWALNVFEGIRGMYERQELCDTVLHAGGREFLCHRVILASASAYFHAMFAGGFAETVQTSIHLNEIPGSSLSSILDYIYMGQTMVDGSTAQDLLVAAHMLQLTSLENQCSDYMVKHIDDSNCVDMMKFASVYNRNQLAQAAKSHTQKRLAAILSRADFLELPADQVADLVALRDIECPQISEETICDAALQWIQHKPQARLKEAYRVLRHIRLTKLQPTYYKELKANAMLRGSPGFTNMLEQVEYLRAHPERWHEVDLVLAERLWPLAHEERMMVFSGLRGKQAFLGSHEGFVEDYLLDAGHGWPPELVQPKLATAKGGRELYLLQGDSKAPSCLYSYNPQSGFVQRAPPTMRRTHCCLVTLDHHLYVLGGSHKGLLSEGLHCYNTLNNRWTQAPNLPCKLRCSCATSYRGKLYVFGGQTVGHTLSKKRTITKLAMCYDPGRGSWTELNSMVAGRAWAGCAVYRNKIYVLGGVSCEVNKASLSSSRLGVDSALSSCEIYDPQRDRWSQGPALPQPLAAPGAVKYLGTIYVIGGVGRSGPNNDVYVLTEDGSHWVCQKGALNHTHPPVTPTMFSSYTTVTMISHHGSLEHTDSESSFDSTATSMQRRYSSDSNSSLDENYNFHQPDRISVESSSSDDDYHW